MKYRTSREPSREEDQHRAAPGSLNGSGEAPRPLTAWWICPGKHKFLNWNFIFSLLLYLFIFSFEPFLLLLNILVSLPFFFFLMKFILCKLICLKGTVFLRVTFAVRFQITELWRGFHYRRRGIAQVAVKWTERIPCTSVIRGVLLSSCIVFAAGQ